jgi:hypothetical protein
MKLYSHRALPTHAASMFIAEKGITKIEQVPVDL